MSWFQGIPYNTFDIDDRTKVYMQIKGTELAGNIFWAPNFKTRFVDYASLRQMKNKRGQ